MRAELFPNVYDVVQCMINSDVETEETIIRRYESAYKGLPLSQRLKILLGVGRIC